MIKGILTFVIVLLLSQVSVAQKTVILTDSTLEICLSREYVNYFVDTSSNLTVQEIIKHHSKDFMPSYADDLINDDINAAYWLRFKIVSDATAQSFRVELFDFDIDEIDFYTIHSSDSISHRKAGYKYPFHYRRVKHKNAGFNIAIPDDESQEFYMRFRSSRRNVLEPMIRSYEQTLNYGLAEYMYLGVFYGLLLIMIFYNFLYFIILRRFHYLFYVLYAAGILIYLMNRNGTGFQYLWPNYPQINPYMDDISLFLSTVSMIMFTIYFLDLKNNDNQYRKFLHGAIVVRVGLLFVQMFTNTDFSWILVDAVYTQFAFVAGIKLYNKKVRSSRWFIIAFSIFNIAFLITSFEINGWIPSSIFTVYALNIGIVLQFVFLSISIAESVKDTFIEKNHAQARLIMMQEQTNEELEQNVKDRTLELELQTRLVEQKNADIMASVRYAKTIQNAILPHNEQLKIPKEQHFILYLPRDIVSGDFYWYHSINEHEYLIIAADCTGHGIPGAFMSMIGINLLNRIISEGIIMPDKILSELHKNIQLVLNQKASNNQDGMDMAICKVNTNEKTVQYSGARNPLVYIMDGVLKKIKATRTSIGGSEEPEEKTFELHEISYKDNEICFYIYSDGYVDQFGGDKNTKYLTKTLTNSLLEIHKKPMLEQQTILHKNIIDWMGEEHQQIDDILLIGVVEF